MAQYDLPAIIYYILNQTGHEQLYYVGHSQGTAIAFARFSEDQELASRVKHLMALAPISRVGHITSPPLRLMLPFATEIETAQLVVASLRGQEVAGSKHSRAQSGPLLVGSVSV
ncbi:lipase [Elysia marginata]|uniref:Lipase n=1 Tax=Elysia marginata TaxID=1093978 RepID=A0AAV4JWN8_9GAST|nr:lipase [Elysia marginata]